MATIDHSASDQFFPKADDAASGSSWFSKALQGLQHGWRAHLRYQRLSRLSDEALRKRGLRRDQIAHLAFFGDSEH